MLRDTNTLFLTNQSPAALQYTSTTGSRVVGKFERGIGITDKYLFPLGSDSNYNPLNLTLNAIQANGSVVSEFVPADPGNSGLPLPDPGYVDPADSVEVWRADSIGFWSLKANGFASNNYNLSLDGTGFLTPYQNVTRLLTRDAAGDWTLDGDHEDAIGSVIYRNNMTGGIPGTGNHYGWGHIKPRIQTQPADTAVCDGESADFSIVVTGRGTLEYRWEVNTESTSGVGGWTTVDNGGIYSNATTDTLHIASTDLSMDGYKYRVIVTDSLGNFKRSNAQATLTVNPRPVATAIPQKDTVCNGTETNIELTSDVTGTTFEIEVLYSGSIAGTSTTLDGNYIRHTLTNPTTDYDSVIYRIIPTGPFSTFCSGTEDTVVVWVEPTVKINALSDTLCNNETTNIMVTSPNTTTNGIRYTWTVAPDANIVGATNSPGKGQDIGTAITQQLTNTGLVAQKVTYTITPWTVNANDDNECTDAGEVITVDIWVEPTPEISVSVPDTIVCNEAPFTFTIDSVTSTTGTMKYHFDVTYPAGVTGNLTDGDFDISNVGETLVNTTNEVQAVTYYFDAYIDRPGNASHCDNGLDTTITIYVNPTPEFTVEVADTVVCDSSTITFNVTDLLGDVLGDKVYDLATNQSGGITGIQPDGQYNMPDDVTDQLINTTNEVQTVTYNFRYRLNDSRNGGAPFCDHGIDTSITIYVNPTPDFTVTVADTIVCDSTTITLDVADLLGAVQGDKVYDLSTSQSGGIDGIQPDGQYDMPVDVVDQLINTTSEVQSVTYYFRYRLNDSRNGGAPFCDHGIDTSITIYVNPTPEFTVEVADTVVCDSSTITFNVTDLLGDVLGDKVYDLATNQSGGITGIQPDGQYNMPDDVTDQLINTTNEVQTVTYNFRYRLNDSRNGGAPFCDHGIDTSITIYVNPTPDFTVTVADTIVCDSTTITLDVADLLGAVQGDKVYDLSTSQSGGIDGIQPDGQYDMPVDVVDQLINTTSEVQSVTYYFRYRLNDSRNGGAPFCDHGIDTSITIYVNPTPEFTVEVADTVVCDSSTITFNVTDLLGDVLGDKVYDLATNQSGGITGIQPDGQYNMPDDVTDQLINTTKEVQTVTYNFRYRLNDSRNGGAPFCDHGIDTSITIYVNPTPDFTVTVADTIVCDSTIVTLDVTDLLGAVQGDKVYDLITSQSGGIDGIQPDGQYDMPVDVVDQLVNTTNEPQWVTYYFRYRLNDSRNGGAPFCDHGIDTSITIYVNPTPVVNITVLQDTLCNDTRTSITLSTPTTLTSGLVTFDYSTVAESGLSGHTNSTGRPNGYTIEDLLHNSTAFPASPQTVTYTITPQASPVGCTSGPSKVVDIVVHPTPDSYFDPENTNDSVTCYLDSDAYATIVAQNGINIFTYQWDDPASQTGTLATGLSEGLYHVTITDNQGCTKVDSIEVKQPDLLIFADDSLKNVTCFNYSDGYISVTPGGGNGTYSYHWSTGSTTNYISNLPGDRYYVTVTDWKGCNIDTNIVVYEPAPVSADISYTDVTCNGYDNGWARLAVSGATDYVWSTGSTEQEIDNLAPGYYFVTATYSGNCEIYKNVEIKEPDPLTTHIDSFLISCAGDGDGRLDLSVFGGNQEYPLNYEWSNGATTQDLDSVPGDFYKVTVTDFKGCVAYDSAIVGEPPTFYTDITFDPVTCFGYDDGFIYAEAHGGNPGDYNYFWSNGATDSVLNNLTPGSYELTVTDSKDCEIYDTVDITEPDKLEISDTTTDITCYGFNDGTVSLTVTGGNGGYIYDWSSGHDQPDLTGLVAGDYYITVSDVKDCSVSDTITITEPEDIINVTDVEQILCYGDDDGSIEINTSGGISPYNYSWSHDATLTANLAENLAAGTYFITVTDENECIKELSESITQPDRMDINITSADITCYGFGDGYIIVDASGGVPEYVYTWSDGTEEPENYALEEGTYDVTITDANNCSEDTAITIFEPDPLAVSPDIVLPYCPDMAEGSIELNITGGTGFYDVIWSTDQVGPNQYNLRTGRYEITITDENLCRFDTLIYLGSVRETCITIPSAFTPNGDIYNEKWVIEMNGVYPNATIEVFDRTGKRVFYSRGYEPSQYWDGTYNGKKLPMDSYYYVINLNNGAERISGVVTIIR